MRRLFLLLSILIAFFATIITLYKPNIFQTVSITTNIAILTLKTYLSSLTTKSNITTTISNHQPLSSSPPPSSMNAAKTTMSRTLHHAKITPHLSSTRGHSDHGWLNTYHSFSFANWYNPSYTSFGSLRVLNEDRVKPQSGFPTHPHRDFEIFSYILSGELTHRDSMLTKGAEGADVSPDQFYRMKRGDVQFTTGGTGIAHSEFNEHKKDTVHFLQIWALPWRRGLKPRYHTRHFSEEEKKKAFVTILSPLKGGADATAEEEAKAEPVVEGTIPIHADFLMGAGIIKEGNKFEWIVGGRGNVTEQNKRKVFVHLPMTKGGRASIRLDGRDDAVLKEGDGAFIENVNKGDKLWVESVGEVEAEVVVLDTA
ncbi:RmlC-like cupin domain-containing protein [Apiosordaria backusii]|uniref:RmlC-like cupin domain-containing protein n=1 Tax=Apiosordaria backusii TaxID=314023 RepID=A0AA40AXR1_9PEZI|nr:RmlC-like cupin domain-containing protein [Apiosordaria backusii]